MNMEYEISNDIAIIGISCRFPGADNPTQFWKNLIEGKESIRFFSDEELAEAGVDAEVYNKRNYIRAHGAIDSIENFDAAFFGYLPKEAELIDPQHRIFLEQAWAALEDAGYDPFQYKGLISVFGGVARNAYQTEILSINNELRHQLGDYHLTIGNEKDFVTTRVSYKLDLKGPSYDIQTACSTGLVATHVACQSLQNGECDIALVGGGRVQVPQNTGYTYVDGETLSSDGHCRAFSDDASGMVRGSGVGFIALKRLDDVIEDRDHVYAVIKSSAVNNDGADKAGFMAPSVQGQSAVIAEAIEIAGLTADNIGYVETHGTGTAIGDPIEIAALTDAFRKTTNKRQFCPIGSVKPNIGHLDAGAGIAGIIKTAFALCYESIPPSINFSMPNRQIDFAGSPFMVNDHLRSWKRSMSPRRAGVSSFGIGGTNVHLILEEAPQQPDKKADENLKKESNLFLFSAKTETALSNLIHSHGQYMERNADCRLCDASFTLAIGRSRMKYRYSLVAENREELVLQTNCFDPSHMEYCEVQNRPVVFMFSGQGGHYVGMGKKLYQTEPVFKKAVDHCTDLAKNKFAGDIRKFLLDRGDYKISSAFQETQFIQPVLFTLEYALAQLWLSWGIKPAALIGHSLGEYTAACISGVMGLADTIDLVIQRGKLMQGMLPGFMVAVALSEVEALQYCSDEIVLTGINGPMACVLGGALKYRDDMLNRLKRNGVTHKLLPISHACHTPMMKPMLDDFREVLSRIVWYSPKIPMISNVEGAWLDRTIDVDYWCEHLIKTVRFHDGLSVLIDELDPIFLEVGPGKALTSLAVQQASSGCALPSLPSENEPTLCKFTLQTLGRLWQKGVDIDWNIHFRNTVHRRASLPTYPFDRKRFWVSPYKTRSEMKDAELKPNEIKELNDPSHCETILCKLKDIFHEFSGVPVENFKNQLDFMDFGFDSLFLTRIMAEVQNEFQVEISFRQLFEETPNLELLAGYIKKQLPSNSLYLQPANSDSPKKNSLSTVAIQKENVSEDIKTIINRQLDLMEQQIQILSGIHTETRTIKSMVEIESSLNKVKGDTERHDEISDYRHGPWRAISETKNTNIQAQYKKQLDQLITDYNNLTKGSKQLTDKQRSHLADPRAVTGFRREWKEIIYQLAILRSKGSKIWDVDGNEYIDLVMSFGIALFGHNPDFIKQAVAKQLETGFELGVLTPLAQRAAELFCQVTGMERVNFVNTGSEAVSAAVRIARTVTGKKKIAMFNQDYHGISDELLARPLFHAKRGSAIPVAPGIPDNLVNQVIILDYDDPDLEKVILEHGDELAAIIVEPIQAARPDFHPKRQLIRIREISSKNNIALIFDELITGFRLAPKGARQWYGVDADICCYGKVLSGGMPLAAVAGNARFLDAFDGGKWQFGDDSFPEARVTFFGGTFVRHPLCLAATIAVLEYIKSQGDVIYNRLNKRTERFAASVNAIFNNLKAPVKLVFGGSMIRFVFEGNNPVYQLFYIYMRLSGVHVTDRAGFLSIAHSNEDLERILDAIRESTMAMVEAGFFKSDFSMPTLLNQHEWALQRETELLSESDVTSMIDMKPLCDQLTELTCYYFYEYIEQFIPKVENKGAFKANDLKSVLGISKDYEKMFLYMLDLLIENRNIVPKNDGTFQFKQIKKRLSASNLLENIEAEYPEVTGTLQMLAHCASYLGDVLTGRVPGVSVLYKDGKRDFLKHTLNEKTKPYKAIDVYITLLSELIANRVKQGPLTILEVGAGSGQLSKRLFPLLKGKNVQYTVTDISPLCVRELNEYTEQKGFSFVHGTPFDINQDPISQSLPEYAYDLVLAINVVHATPDIFASLTNLKKLLKKHGELCLIEYTYAYSWENLIWGMTRGWWVSNDNYRSILPLIKAQQWCDACSSVGFSRAVKYEAMDTSLIIAGWDKTPVPDESVPKKLPLSKKQYEIWIASMIDNDVSVSYNLGSSIQLIGPLDRFKLIDSLNELIQRHDALRTIFDSDGEFQIIVPKVEIKINEIDISDFDRNARSRKMDDIYAEEMATPFSLSTGPFLRVSLVKCEHNLHELLIIVHHIICDGISFGILVNDLATIYSDNYILPDINYSIPDDSSQYEKEKEDLKYWKNVLTPLPESLEIPTLENPMRIPSHLSDRVSLHFDQDLSRRVNRISKEYKCTPFVFLFSIFILWLSRLSGILDVVVGVTISRRNSKNENLIGHFVNLLPVRQKIDVNESFLAFLQRTRSVVLDAFDHQHCVFSDILKELSVRRDKDHPPLVPLVFNMDFSNTDLDFGDLQAVSKPLIKKRENFNLFFNIVKSPERYSIQCTYKCNLFTSSLIEYWLNFYREMTERICIDIRQSISETFTLSNEMKSSLADICFGETSPPSPFKSVAEIFEHQVENTPKAIAVVAIDGEMSYQELNHLSNKLANHIARKGVTQGSLVGVGLKRNLRLPALLLAIHKLGAAYVPLDYSYPEERLAYMIEHSGMNFLVTEGGLLSGRATSSLKVVDLDLEEEEIEKSEITKPGVAVNGDMTAYVIYTSGSTGKPKGVEIGQKALINFLLSMSSRPGFSRTDVLLAITTLSFDISALEFFLPLINGGKVVVTSREQALDGERLVSLIEKHGVTIMQATPSSWRLLIEAQWKGKKGFAALCGGETLPEDLATALLQKKCTLWNMYGPTETTIWSTCCPIYDPSTSTITIGTPIANTQCYIFGQDNKLVPLGVWGELFIGGDGLAKGYLHDNAKTERQFVYIEIDSNKKRLYRTGDRARYLPDGSIEFGGRLDTQVKLRGYRIELGEIETLLHNSGLVKQCAAIISEMNGSMLVVYYTIIGESVEPAILKNYLRNFLPAYMIPNRFVEIDSLPLTPNGKIDRKKLALQSVAVNEDTRVRRPPATKTQNTLASIWKDLLSLDAVALEDDFFEIGGYSVLVMKMTNRIFAQYGVRIQPTDIFERSVLEELSDLIDDLLAPTMNQCDEEINTKHEREVFEF